MSRDPRRLEQFSILLYKHLAYYVCQLLSIVDDFSCPTSGDGVAICVTASPITYLYFTSCAHYSRRPTSGGGVAIYVTTSPITFLHFTSNVHYSRSPTFGGGASGLMRITGVV